MDTFKKKNPIWSVGKVPNTIVTNVKPMPGLSDLDYQKEKDKYGGYLVCESITNAYNARLIANAPILLECLKEAVESLEYERNRAPENWYEVIERVEEGEGGTIKEEEEVVFDDMPLNEKQNREVFEVFGEIDFSDVGLIYRINGLGDALANQTGLYFLRWPSKVVKTLGDLKKLYKFATSKELIPKAKHTAVDNEGREQAVCPRCKFEPMIKVDGKNNCEMCGYNIGDGEYETTWRVYELMKHLLTGNIQEVIVLGGTIYEIQERDIILKDYPDSLNAKAPNRIYFKTKDPYNHFSVTDELSNDEILQFEHLKKNIRKYQCIRYVKDGEIVRVDVGDMDVGGIKEVIERGNELRMVNLRSSSKLLGFKKK